MFTKRDLPKPSLWLEAAARHLAARVDVIVSGLSLVPSGVIDHTPRRYTTLVWNAFVDAVGA